MTPEGNTPLEIAGETRTENLTPITVPSVGTWEWDARTGSIAWSDEIYLIFGLDSRSFDPDIEKIKSLTIEEDRWVHAINAKDSAPVAYSIYYRIRRSDGTLRTVRETG